MKFKKLLSFLLVTSVVLLLVACGGSDEKAKPNKQEASGEMERKGDEKEGQNKKKSQIINLTLKETAADELSVETKAEGHNIEYAYYVMTEEDEVIEKFMYDQGSEFSYKISQPGRYKVRVFVRNQDGDKDRQDTEIVEFPY